MIVIFQDKVPEHVYTVLRKKVVYFVFEVTLQLYARFSYNFQWPLQRN